MLERFLPHFQNRQPKPPQNPENPQSDQFNYGSSDSPNFVLQKELTNPTYFYHDKLARLFKKLSFVILICFIGLLLVSIYLDLKLESERKLLNQVADQADDYTLIRKLAEDVDAKTKFYTKSLNERIPVGDKASVVFTSFTPNTKFLVGTIETGKFLITIQVPSALEFGLLIDSYLKSDKIADLSLHSADLIRSENAYKVVIEGTFK